MYMQVYTQKDINKMQPPQTLINSSIARDMNNFNKV